MFTLVFWKATAERAIKTFAQSIILVWGADEMFNLWEANVGEALGVGAGGFVLSVLTSVASGAATGTSGPSLTNSEITRKESHGPDSGDGHTERGL